MNAVYFESPERDVNPAVVNVAGSPETMGDVLGSAGTIDEILGNNDRKAAPKKRRSPQSAKARDQKKTPSGNGSTARDVAISNVESIAGTVTNDDIEQLRKQMNKAVSVEDYEEAARLRDIIHGLEQKAGRR